MPELGYYSNVVRLVDEHGAQSAKLLLERKKDPVWSSIARDVRRVAKKYGW